MDVLNELASNMEIGEKYLAPVNDDVREAEKIFNEEMHKAFPEAKGNCEPVYVGDMIRDKLDELSMLRAAQ